MNTEIYDYIDRIEKFNQFKVLGYNVNNPKDPGAIIYSIIEDKFITSSIYNLYTLLITYQRPYYNNTIEVQKDLDLRFGPNEYMVLEHKEINTKQDKIKVKHSCGHIYDISLRNLLDPRKEDNSTCEACKGKGPSKGERKIKDWLDKNNYLYKFQYKNENCKDILALPFDFGIFSPKTKKLVAIIEFDGIQHFKPMGYSNSEEKFMTTQRHDVIKDLFCERNNIPLKRINYKEENNIPDILNKFLDSLI